MIQKVLPIIQYHICTDFGISTKSYSNKYSALGGTGQENSVLEAICRDTSCLIFKYIEEKNLGAIIHIKRTNTRIQYIAIAFINDTDFYSNRLDYENNI